MSKPNYRVQLTFDPERKLFLARVPELEHCTAEGATRAEAIGKVEEEIDAQLANMLSHGSQPPRSVDEEEFTGEIVAKVTKLLHRDLAFQARSEGVEIDQLLGELLSAAMVERKQTRQRGGNRAPQHHGNNFDDSIGNRGPGGGGRGFGRNAQLMDDRASFIEYVRGLEQGGGQQHRGGGGGGMGGHHNNGGHQGGGRRRRGRGGGGGGGGGGYRPDNRPSQGPSGNPGMQASPSGGGNGGPSNGGNPGNRGPGDDGNA
jgi:predicted RNase H-like HicB family nuclease